MKFQVLIDRGFRGVPAAGVGEWDEADPEVRKNAEAGFLAPLEKKSTPSPAAGHSEDDEPKKEG